MSGKKAKFSLVGNGRGRGGPSTRPAVNMMRIQSGTSYVVWVYAVVQIHDRTFEVIAITRCKLVCRTIKVAFLASLAVLETSEGILVTSQLRYDCVAEWGESVLMAVQRSQRVVQRAHNVLRRGESDSSRRDRGRSDAGKLDLQKDRDDGFYNACLGRSEV